MKYYVKLSLFALALVACQLALAAPNPRVGFYQWSAVRLAGRSEDLLTLARERIKAVDAGLLRLYVGARFDYREPVLSPGRFRDLPEPTPARIVGLSHYRAVLEDPEIPTVVLTVYPGMDYGAGLDDINLTRPWGARERSHEYAAILDLASLLLTKYGRLDKTVIIINTEADDKMLEIMNYTGSSDLAIENLREWQNTRHDAVAAARRAHPDAKLRLLNGFEISLIHLKILRVGDRFIKHPRGRWNALTDVVPFVRFDLLSYSAYESTNSPYETQNIAAPASDVGPRLLRDLTHLKETVRKPVMIGELGVAYDLFDRLPTGGVAARLSSALMAVGQFQPAYVIFWQVFDAPVEGREPVQFGWLDPKRAVPPILLSFISRFGRRSGDVSARH